MKKVMQHNEYMKKVKILTDAQLRYIIEDCREAIKAFPEGINVGYYMDEIHYCYMELRKRYEKLGVIKAK
jgi:hypothetical protein